MEPTQPRRPRALGQQARAPTQQVGLRLVGERPWPGSAPCSHTSFIVELGRGRATSSTPRPSRSSSTAGAAGASSSTPRDGRIATHPVAWRVASVALALAPSSRTALPEARLAAEDRTGQGQDGRVPVRVDGQAPRLLVSRRSQAMRNSAPRLRRTGRAVPS
eukprot:scaffold201_cov405-Prasinococcus_capsulatus_cf.AAC.59